MITQQVIDALYKKYNKAPKSLDYLDMPLLFDATSPHHDVSVDIDDNMRAELVIGSIDEKSPFHRLPMHRIHAIVPFEEWVAINTRICDSDAFIYNISEQKRQPCFGQSKACWRQFYR